MTQKEKYVPKRAKKPRKKMWLLPLLLLLGVLLLTAIAYVVLCFKAPSELIFQQTTINGVDVSSLTVEQAAQQVQQKFEADYGEAAISVSAEGKTYQVSLAGVLSMDAQGLAQQAYDACHGALLTRGWQFLKLRVTGADYAANPSLASEETLTANIEASGLMEINTTVQTTWEVKDDQLVFTKGITGVSVDETALAAAIGSAVAKADYTSTIPCPMLSGTVDTVDVDAIHKKIYKKKKNATLNPKKDYAIVDSVTGVSFDTDAAVKQLDEAAEGSMVAIDLKYSEPKVTTQKLKDNLFSDVLGTYTTDVAGTSARIGNVTLAAEKINGTILLAGDAFSYNETVGERTTANGFQAAGAYVNGNSVQEVGGGICQVSSTLYAATLYSNLKIVQRQNHTYASSYIPLGMDATVSWGGPDYQFSNDTAYPIKIVANYDNGQVTCTIYGTKTDQITVKIKSETRSTTDFSTIYKDDSSMYEGESYTSVSGYTGYTVQTYRVLYEDGNKISSEEEAYSTYSSRDAIVYRGTKKKVVVPPPTTETPSTGTTGTTGTAGTTANQSGTTAANGTGA